MKILNLYACLGGNRYKWGDEHQITAVEIDPHLAKMYQERFPNDKLVVGDAHQYLLEHFSEFDFIWTSPPCPSHSRARFWNRKLDAIYPDMSLYQEIILLQNHFDGLFCVENVIPYYQPLIRGVVRGRHTYWTNFPLPSVLSDRKIEMVGNDELKRFELFHDIDISQYKGNQRKDKIVRNLVDYEAGKTILDAALKRPQKQDFEQLSLL